MYYVVLEGERGRGEVEREREDWGMVPELTFA
jgi:hypothetical protein